MTRPYRLALILIAALGTAAPALAQQPEGIRREGPFIDVWNNRGGNVLRMVQTRQELASSGRTVRIRGYCRSACTILTTMPNACLDRQATIGFHAPRIAGTRIIPPYVDQIMGNFYRNQVQERWYGGWNRTMDMHVLTANQYVWLDPQTQICPSLR